jgi:hypothetical protein
MAPSQTLSNEEYHMLRTTALKVVRHLGIVANPTDKRVFAIAQTLHEGTMDIDEIHNISKIDYWFLYKLEKIVNTWKKLEGVGGGLGSVSRDLMLEAKQMGYR